MSKDRVYTIDHNVSDREPFLQAQRELLGELGTYDLIAFGKLKIKSAFKMYCRAFNIEPSLANEVSKQIEKYENALKYQDEDDDEELDIFDYVDKEQYGYLIDGCQHYLGIIESKKAHACGCLAYDGDIEEDVGIVRCKSDTGKGKDTLVALIGSDTIDAFGYLKQDYLIVDSVGLIYDIYDEIGQEPLTVNELSEKISNDENVWNIYSDGKTMCINQVEQEKTTTKATRYKPKNISELTQFIAGIRPSFKSMYHLFEARKHFEYEIKAFDELIQDEYCDSSFILYQEHLMKVLGFAGFPMSETYNIIKAISKKKLKVITEAESKFVPNFAKSIIDTGETDDMEKATELAHKVWTIVRDSAEYGFNCVSGNTKLLRSSANGKFQPTVSEMYKIKNDKNYALKTNHKSLNYKYNKYGYGKALSLFDDGRIYENDIIDIYEQGVQVVFKLTTKSGKEIICTENHKFPTSKGKLELSKLKAGDYLYIKDDYNNGRTKRYENGYSTYLDEIISIEPHGEEMVYDIEMASPTHTFVLDNGLVTSNSAHAYCMAIDSVTLAYLKSKFPFAFYKVTLQRFTNKGNKDKVTKIKKELKSQNIKLKPIKFRDDNREFTIDYDNRCINQTMGSVKNISKICAEELYKMKDLELSDAIDLFVALEHSPLKKTDTTALIKLNYFSEFGNINFLLTAYTQFKLRYKKSHIEKTRTARIAELKEYLNEIKDIQTKSMERLKYEVEIMSYTDVVSPKCPETIYVFENIEVNGWGTPWATAYQIKTGERKQVKLNKQLYGSNSDVKGKLVQAVIKEKQKSRKDKDGNWHKLDETEFYCDAFKLI